MAIGVVADERAVLQPYDAFGTQPFLQPFFYLLLCQRLVAVRGHQTAGGRENGSFAIALDAAPFEYEVQMRFVCSLNRASVEQLAVDLVVQFGRELLAPAVEAEVEEEF